MHNNKHEFPVQDHTKILSLSFVNVIYTYSVCVINTTLFCCLLNGTEYVIGVINCRMTQCIIMTVTYHTSYFLSKDYISTVSSMLSLPKDSETFGTKLFVISTFYHGSPTCQVRQHATNSFHLQLLIMEKVFDKFPYLSTNSICLQNEYKQNIKC